MQYYDYTVANCLLQMVNITDVQLSCSVDKMLPSGKVCCLIY